MKILHTEWSAGWGGQEIRVLSEMVAMRDRGVNFFLACRAGSRIGERAREEGFAVYDFAFKHAFDVGTIVGIWRLIRREGIDLVHTHSSIDGYCGGIAGRLAGVPVVRSRHLSSEVRPKWKARFTYGWLPSRVISSGRHIRDFLVNECGCPAEKHVSVAAGADERRFHPGVDGASRRRELGFGDRDVVIGIVAVLRSWKGHHVLIEAFDRLRGDFPEARLLIVGDGPGRNELEGMVARLGLGDRVRFTGHRQDVPEMMKAMDVLVLPSLKNEGTPQVLPQAMLVGTPVVCSSAGGITEVVEDGVRGRVVPPGDVAALAKALREALTDKEATARMAKAARAYALEHFTFKKQVADTYAVYAELLNQSG